MEIFFAILKAFAVGGVICFLAQVLMDYTRWTLCRILVGLVVLGAVLGACGVYEPFAEWAGAGATAPLSGFGNAMVRGVREAIEKQGWIGILTGSFTAASAGVGAAAFCGLLAAIFSKPKEK
ncbi:MAG: SpoVA/SpoVAEb family sporulation membrane protein [Oscillospiraceae bacterium]|jgi:stage V sporulation protein AE|nr:SpoVA/SpoVAEb family sporulation membrane protein [Oscillospiraceae bacterium]